MHADGKSKGTASIHNMSGHNMSTVDSVSSVQRVAAEVAANGPGINHGFAASRSAISIVPQDGNGHVAVPIQDKDSAEIYGADG